VAYVITAFLVSLVVTLLVIRYSHLHARFTADTDMTGVQKYHTRPVPRVGGVSIVLGLLGVWIIACFRDPFEFRSLGLLLLCGMPAFLGGLAEDLLKTVSVLTRLGLAMLAGALAYYALGAAVLKVDIPGIDWLLQFGLFSFVFTVVAVGGAANAINIIDGYNGLAAFVAASIFAGFAYVSFYLGDRMLLVASVGMIGGIMGFFIWNYPRGLIFLGDGGAYFLGYMIGEISVLLMVRHPQVSAWFPLLLCIYPVFETLFSIYRKRLLRGRSPGMPDGVHLHMLIYKRLVRWAVGSTNERHKTQRNAMTSPYLWVLSSLGVIPAVLFWEHKFILMLFVVIFAFSYVYLYRTLVRFGSPKWMVVTRRERK
jgi:UDP-N-acetylmuramyl pentapeptide phosphotransferase/UDP-N-acetylglucosamine-1-phosphate transferase